MIHRLNWATQSSFLTSHTAQPLGNQLKHHDASFRQTLDGKALPLPLLNYSTIEEKKMPLDLKNENISG